MGDADWKISLGVGVLLLSLGGCTPGEGAEQSSSEDAGSRLAMERGTPGPLDREVLENELGVVTDLGLEQGVIDQSFFEERGPMNDRLDSRLTYIVWL